MKEQKKQSQGWTAVKCPHCGWEYVPAEIFLPGELLGRPRTVVRDALGKVIYVDWEDGEEPCLTEEFECEGCGRSFVVEAQLTLKARPQAEELDFGEQSVSLFD